MLIKMLFKLLVEEVDIAARRVFQFSDYKHAVKPGIDKYVGLVELFEHELLLAVQVHNKFSRRDVAVRSAFFHASNRVRRSQALTK